MMHELNTYITSSNVHGECDLCRMDGSINEVISGNHLCRGCIENVDGRADALVFDDDSDFDKMEEAFKHVVEQNVGATIVLHFPTADGPTPSRTYTVENVEDFEIEFGDENTVTITRAGGDTDTYTGNGLTVTGMTL